MTLRTPAFNEAKTYPAGWLRYAVELSVVQPGVVPSNGLYVSPAAAGGQRVDIDQGTCLVKGDSGIPATGLSQGYYVVVNDAPMANAVTLAASNGSLPRVDQIAVRVRDTQALSGGGDDASFLVLTGTATSGATLDNRSGAAALPPDHERLADILVPAGSTAVTAGNVRDRRQRANGHHVLWDEDKTAASLGAPYSPLMSGGVEAAQAGRALVTWHQHAVGNTVAYSSLIGKLTVNGVEVWPLSPMSANQLAWTNDSLNTLHDASYSAEVPIPAGQSSIYLSLACTPPAGAWTAIGRFSMQAQILSQ